jgi:type IV pilus assembly protein PilM
MPLLFLSNLFRKKTQEVLAVDLGRRTTKAVHLQRDSDGLVLRGCAVLDALPFERALSPEGVATQLKTLSETFHTRVSSVALAVGANDALIRTVEVPPMPLHDLRQVLRRGSRHYLQQDLADHVFDGQVLSSYVQANRAQVGTPERTGVRKQRVLVAGARQQLVSDLAQGVRQAGLVPQHIMPGLLALVNAFQLAMPESVHGTVVALVDIGFKTSSICILDHGELALSRVLAIGGDRLTAALSEALHISYAEAEGIKLGGLLESYAALEPMLASLGRELKASLDFFEHQHEKPVTRVFVAGGGAKSALILESLQGELMVGCKSWDPTHWLKLALPSRQAEELQHIAPQLGVALGTAQAVL